MASLPNNSQPLRPSLASGLRNALDVYGHITPPNEHDDSDSTRFIGRCLVELNEEQRRCNERLFDIENRASRESQNDQTTFSSIDDKVDAIWEEIGELKSKVGNIEDKVLNIEDAVATVKEDIQEIDSKIDDVEACLTRSIVQLEKNVDGRFSDLERRFSDLETKVDSLETKVDSLETKVDSLETKVDSLETKVDSLETNFNQFQLSVQSQFKNMQALYKNGNADRFYAIVEPIGVEYQDSRGYTHYRLPLGPPQSVKYYWKLHRSKHYNKLKALHEFYQIPYTGWSTNDDSSDDDDIDPPWRPSSLEAAIAKFPTQAVRALFGCLGLVYSKFEEQAEKLQALDQGLGKTAEKRASKQALPFGTPRSKVRRQSPSAGLTTEPPTSSTESRDSVALVGYNQ